MAVRLTRGLDNVVALYNALSLSDGRIDAICSSSSAISFKSIDALFAFSAAAETVSFGCDILYYLFVLFTLEI